MSEHNVVGTIGFTTLSKKQWLYGKFKHNIAGIIGLTTGIKIVLLETMVSQHLNSYILLNYSIVDMCKINDAKTNGCSNII